MFLLHSYAHLLLGGADPRGGITALAADLAKVRPSDEIKRRPPVGKAVNISCPSNYGLSRLTVKR